MAQLLHHQDSAFYSKELHGCRWGILQFFGFRRRLRSTKMLSDNKHGQGKSSGGSKRRSSYAPLKNEDSGIMDDETNTEVAKKQKASKKNSGKASLRSLILRKLYGKEGQKEKMLPVAPKLLRTISIHYLESNEYVLDGESTSSGDGSSHSTKLSMQNSMDSTLRHSTSSIPDGCDSDLSSSLLLKRDDSHVKRKSHRSISMDGILHKVPYGKKVSGDIVSEGLPRSASATYDRDGLKPYTGPAAKRHVSQGFRRSRSLSESLENYSRLLDAISSSESKRILTSSKSTRDHSLDVPSVMTSSQRASEIEFRSQGLCRLDENQTAEDALAPHAQEKTDVDADANVAMDDISSDVVAGESEKPALLEECVDDKKFDVAVSAEEDSCIVPSPSEVVDTSEEQAATCGNNDQVPSSAEVDLCAAHSMSEEVDILEEHAETCNDAQIPSSAQADSCTVLLSEDTEIAEEETPTFPDNQMHSFQFPKSPKGTSCVPDHSHEFEADISLSCEHESESPISVLDVAFSADPASLVKHTPLDDTSLKPRILHLNDADVSADTTIVQESGFDDLNGFQVDPSHEVEFNYVNDIFKKSSFYNEILFDEWYSQNIAALQEEDCQHYEAAAAAFDFTQMSADQLLLFDLTNEALLDIYKKYSVSKSKFSWFSSSGRPKPVGHRVLKDLWSRVSSRLDERPWSSIEVDTILSKDLAKSDHWMNFEREADHMGNKVADFVFDKLLTELVLQLAEF
ncbi:uncharacterized protein LOC120673548 isoform X1 [Panicum virgatum]|uniref:DUF4378 domain-containing protein n=2 Tax=Panicum virgatum TaxID=38727 RepID=A0A8T0RP93_PANVG|nr:uncharacterized protein LOC120673548 isoform X1 [Panicum virgatum]XP_039810369.1 uncharacterized protein LOC120673548 isoform X1 [Panicum virgatum]XP_039810370.1 uncharacterized protein LOC120673548 isoform X1 [Panicum virgatum]KAG2586988.1 hypothetical protein PVAP13_5NG089400 [Panicum virgatum]KAG2586990.1 hypothetical protein PVAP13_5NG089400 [Panicum virgatum]KAG2586993.1 hypothetical protein PVAP13_5NG089400 [Panicum virgatum]KAG2586995.1 hypothetical protein PVAP13_5NG089400 [Panicum